MAGSTSLTYLMLAIVFIVVLSYPLRMYNKFIFLLNRLDKAFANIDVWLIQRNEEMPNLCSIVSAYSKHERAVLQKITDLRGDYQKANNVTGKVVPANYLSKLIAGLLVRAEASPQLQSDSIYRKTALRIERLEGQISDQRSLYNDAVKIYNTEIQQFPQLLVARALGFRAQLLLTNLEATG